MSRRRPLDAELVRRGLSPDRDAARGAISSGRVVVGGAPATNPDRQVGPGEPVQLLDPPPRYVSRGGEKLHAALARFAIDVRSAHALDVGASTGGFTDCLLAHGAVHVDALDVGRAQLHERLRADPRVRVLERTDVRRVTAAELTAPPAVVTVDVSFVSLRSVAAPILALAGSGADLVVLVKPQFEVRREVVSRGRGVVRDPEEWARALAGAASALDAAGAANMGAMASPLRGADGNVEFLLHVRAPGGDPISGALGPDAVAAVALTVTPEAR